MRSSAVSVLVAALACACTPKPCDEDQLRGVATALDARSPETGPDAALVALTEACPRLPPGLVRSLELSFAFEPSVDWGVGPSRFDDPRYVELRATTCPASGQEWDAATAAPDRDAALFEACELGRYGLVAPGEAFVLEDLEGHVLYEWLTARRIDAELARRLARGLMSADASPAELVHMCRRRRSGCLAAFASHGIEPPASPSPWPLDLGFGPWVGVNGAGVYVEGELVASLADGVAEPGVFVAHRSPALERVLRATLPAEREATPGLAIVASPELPFGTLADVMFTGVRTGYVDWKLVTGDRARARVVYASPPRWWARPGTIERPFDRPEPAELRLGLDAVELGRDPPTTLANLADCSKAPGTCLDEPALVRALAALRAERWTNGSLHVRVDRAVPYETVSALLELARGPECTTPMLDADADEPPCMFLGVTLDTDPGLVWNVGTALRLGDARIQRFDAEGRACGDETPCELDRRAPDPDEVLATYARVRDELAACLEADAGFMREFDDEKISLLWGSPGRYAKQAEPRALVVWTGIPDDLVAPDALNRCVAELFGARPLPVGASLGSFMSELSFALDIPAQFEPPAGG